MEVGILFISQQENTKEGSQREKRSWEECMVLGVSAGGDSHHNATKPSSDNLPRWVHSSQLLSGRTRGVEDVTPSPRFPPPHCSPILVACWNLLGSCIFPPRDSESAWGGAQASVFLKLALRL